MMKTDSGVAMGLEDKNSRGEVEKQKCCAKCCFFEDRTCFCRYNPPIPVVTTLKNGSSFVTSVYSKINMPALDWCQKFEPKA